MADLAATPAHPPQDHQRLWTPWRMRYVGGAPEPGCVLCNRLAVDDDVRSLILHRGEHAFAIMNLYPYNTGHLMLVPNAHVAGPETAASSALAEMAMLVAPTLRALRRALGCHGFNLGLNVGAVAGAGVADHMHQHVVPRWQGDANFMPILAATMVLPELIPVTYAKLRAELTRELAGIDEAACVLLAAEDRLVLVADGPAPRLPVAPATAAEPLWQAARRTADALTGPGSELAGWAGPTQGAVVGIALTFRLPGPTIQGSQLPSGARWTAVEEVLGDRHIGPTVAMALGNLAHAEPT